MTISVRNDDSEQLDYILAAAAEHGQVSDPDHEVGDLQQALRFAWAVMTDEQRELAYERFCDEVELDDDDVDPGFDTWGVVIEEGNDE